MTACTRKICAERVPAWACQEVLWGPRNYMGYNFRLQRPEAAFLLSSEVDTKQYESLAGRVRDGNPDAEAELVHQFTPRIVMMGMVRLRDREATRDLVQDVLIAVISAIRKSKLRDCDKLPAFVAGTARNLINNYLRFRAQHPVDVLPEDLAQPSFESQASESQAEEIERVRLVHRALALVDDDDRRIVTMILVNGLKPGEIAAELGLTAEVVRTRKLRAIKRVSDLVRKMSRI